MATGTLQFVVNGHGALLTCLFLIHIGHVHCQQFLIPFKAPSDCGQKEFFDISSLSCAKCGENQRQSTTGLSCICLPGYKTTNLSSDKGPVACEQCPTNKPAVTKDGFGCIRCPGSLNEEGKCQCSSGNILVERDVNGNLLDEATCKACNSDSPALSVPNISGDKCEKCQATFINTSCMCTSPNVLAGGLCFPSGGLSTNVNPSVNYAQLKFSIQSAWFEENLYSSAAACLLFSNLTACQALGNMCVMNMHSVSSVANDACGLFNTIFSSKTTLSSVQGIAYWKANLPWLYYGNEPGLASRVLQTDPVPVSFSLRGTKKNTDLRLLVAIYNVRGDFLRWEQVGGSNLQFCPESATRQAAAFSFGTAYQQSCDLSVAALLVAHPEPQFYDVFMDVGGQNKNLLPLPTLVQNQQYNGQYINQGTMKNWYLSRRVFLVDTLSGREKSLSSSPKVIRVATTITIRFQLVPRTQVGQIYPPLVSVSYTDVLITDINTQTVSLSFAVEYEMSQTDARTMTDTALGVLGGLALICTLLRTASYKRRIASALIDMATIGKFLLFFAGDLANAFFAVTVGTGLYWLIFYKAQMFVSVLLPTPTQEERFVTYIGCAFAFKAVQFLHELYLQVSVDIFLIDWERPRSKPNRSVQGATDTQQDSSPVSIWRTYFVANEWNELQTIRKICPTFQIVAVLFFLEVLGFSNLALRDPWSTLERLPQAYTPPYSLVLRYGVAATLWLCIGLLQVIFFTVFYEHFVEDKIRQFVDLCSVSNISVLLLSHTCFGYYIHGRSVHGHADTNMEEMNNNLKRERESLCGQRGLVPNSDIQTFQVSINRNLRSQFDRIQGSLSRRNRPSRLMDASTANLSELQFRAYNTMNHFLGSFIDHGLSEMDYVVRDKLILERILGMEFMEASDKSLFYNDEAHSFSNVLFYGNESLLLIFDTLFFCVVDLGSQNFVLAAVLTYAQQTIFGFLRNSLGRRNLVNKTLVDQRFLI
ncbi:meckelin isoform X2 [Austrofundulus limnaeus]|uniref:Meckelin isoform X2 n=1 Tax=Austrofundulus limnaeus TaxID=52670 RepID=A0A2I4AXI5_AUSLI|nr:PREDICTED: meckelin isoform X2 [Austrofundulus limnaeus]